MQICFSQQPTYTLSVLRIMEIKKKKTQDKYSNDGQWKIVKEINLKKQNFRNFPKYWKCFRLTKMWLLLKAVAQDGMETD